jgi:short-subunit dehydrogenase
VKIKNATVLVTGAGSGIGKATALRCAEQGAHVIAVDIDADSAEATAQQCADTADAHGCDVADAEAVTALAQQTGPVDVLVNNAGVGVAGPFLDNELADWEWLRGVNLDGVVYGCHAFGEAMVKRGSGHIVNVASGAGYTPNRNLAAYCASKAAVIMLSQCLRADWAGSGVGVSVICPGLIKTPIATRTRMVGAMADKQDVALKVFRFGHSADTVAKAIVGAVEKNKEIVPVGLESAVAFHVLRNAPGPVRALLARAQVP